MITITMTDDQAAAVRRALIAWRDDMEEVRYALETTKVPDLPAQSSMVTLVSTVITLLEKETS